MPSRSRTQKAARGNSQLRTTMSPLTDSRKSRPVCSPCRSYRCGITDTSRPGSIMRAATIDSSRARFAGFFPCACDKTTVRRERLIDASTGQRSNHRGTETGSRSFGLLHFSSVLASLYLRACHLHIVGFPVIHLDHHLAVRTGFHLERDTLDRHSEVDADTLVNGDPHGFHARILAGLDDGDGGLLLAGGDLRRRVENPIEELLRRPRHWQ